MFLFTLCPLPFLLSSFKGALRELVGDPPSIGAAAWAGVQRQEGAWLSGMGHGAASRWPVAQ